MAFALSSMQLSSDNFSYLEALPKKHSYEGENLSPPLQWHDAPENTQSFAIICHDPDAPLVKNGSYGFVHWLLYNLAADIKQLSENNTLGSVGINDFGNQGYDGPMPPEGHGKHHYYFWVLALDKMLHLEAGLTLPQFLEKVEPHLLGMNRLIGTYQRD